MPSSPGRGPVHQRPFSGRDVARSNGQYGHACETLRPAWKWSGHSDRRGWNPRGWLRGEHDNPLGWRKHEVAAPIQSLEHLQLPDRMVSGQRDRFGQHRSERGGLSPGPSALLPHDTKDEAQFVDGTAPQFDEVLATGSGAGRRWGEIPRSASGRARGIRRPREERRSTSRFEQCRFPLVVTTSAYSMTVSVDGMALGGGPRLVSGGQGLRGCCLRGTGSADPTQVRNSSSYVSLRIQGKFVSSLGRTLVELEPRTIQRRKSRDIADRYTEQFQSLLIYEEAEEVYVYYLCTPRKSFLCYSHIHVI